MDQKGFANILLISILPFLLAALLLAFACAGLIQFEMRMNHLVWTAQIEAQKKARKHIRNLMSKNTTASGLKLSYNAAYTAYMVAPPYLKPVLKIRLEQVMARRRVLDLQQKAIIIEANLELLSHSAKTYQRLLSEGRNQASKMSPILLATFSASMPKRTKLAVEPASSDVAPVYRTKTGFSKLQALEQSWQYGIRMKSPLSSFLSAAADFKRSSKITLYEAGAGWDIEIVRDKSLSKPWFSLPF